MIRSRAFYGFLFAAIVMVVLHVLFAIVLARVRASAIGLACPGFRWDNGGLYSYRLECYQDKGGCVRCSTLGYADAKSMASHADWVDAMKAGRPAQWTGYIACTIGLPVGDMILLQNELNEGGGYGVASGGRSPLVPYPRIRFAKVIWAGAITNFVAYFGFWIVFAEITARLRRVYRWREGRCRICGYDLRGSVTCCPGCGTQIDFGIRLPVHKLSPGNREAK